MKTLKYCKDMGRFYTMDEWHKRNLSIASRKMRSALRAWLAYKLGGLLNAAGYIKRLLRRTDAEFSGKLDHWRRNGNLTVVTGDTTDPFKSHADGKYYTSKKKYRCELHARGYDEVGNDSMSYVKDGLDRDKRKYDKDLMAEVARGYDD